MSFPQQPPATPITQGDYDALLTKVEEIKTANVAFLNEIKAKGADAQPIARAITKAVELQEATETALKRIKLVIIKPTESAMEGA
jgi:hypothetical protein